MDSTTYDDETVVARHETMAMMAVHLPRIQNLVVGDAPPSPMRVCRLGDPGAVRLARLI
jgi:hypothetical protein